MKKHLHIILSIIALLFFANGSNAQSTLIHYWHFNNMGASPPVYHNPGIPAIKADYSRIDTNKALFVYNLIPAASPTYAGYEDFVATISTDYDTLNLRMGATGGTAIRFRNPSDSSYLTFNIPTTHYKNIVLKFTIETSNTTASPTNQTFAYSTDSGTTWKTAGLNITTDTVTPVFSMISVNFGSDTTVNDNPKLIFKITNTVRTTGGGNVRYDNISVDGDTATGSTPPPTLALIHYWHFNNLVGAWHNPGIPAFKADWSALDTNKTAVAYTLIPGAPSNYSGYVDNFGTGAPDSDVYNLRTISSVATPASNCYRFRNPTDSACLVFYIPSTGYKNLVFSYAVEASSVGHGILYNKFSYSTDSGTTWKTTGLSIDSVYTISADTTPQCIFKLVTVSFTAADTTVNNNPKLCFKITPSGNTHPIPASGNDRFDNFTLDGVSINGHLSASQISEQKEYCTLYPNPANTALHINTPAEGSKIIAIYNTMGQRVFIDESKNKLVNIDIANLSSGMYIINVRMQTGETYTLRFVKN